MQCYKSFALFLLLAPVAGAQTTTGTITGLVTDSSGAVIPDVAIVARNVATGTESKAVSSATGNYAITALPVGTYEVSAAMTGFKTWTRAGIALSSGDNLRLDVALEIGSVSERMVITAEAPPLKTESTEVSSTMERKLVEQLPLPVAGIGGGMRNAFSIMMMLPQVKSANGESAFDDFQVGGGQQHDWNVSVDGLSVEMGWRNHVAWMSRLTPAIEAVEEFRIDTASFKAEDGRVSGGNITIVTKSGTNELHGGLFEYYQSQRFNANTWANNKFGRRNPVFHRNDFGASAGGPVYLPKVYNGKNKTFFFFSYEGYRFPQTFGVSELTVPLPEMRQGDFSAWKRANGALIPIYDPTTTRSDGAGGFVREVFPSNLIPQSRISPISRKIMSYYPDPNAPGLVRNYRTTGTGPKKRLDDAWLGKLDHSFGVRNRLSVTWNKAGDREENAYDRDRTNPANFANSLPFPLVDYQFTHGSQHYGDLYRFNDTCMITPALINTLSLGYHRIRWPLHVVQSDPKGQNWGQVLGGVLNNPYYNDGFPSVRFNNDNYYGWRTNRDYDEFHNVYGLSDSLSWTRRNHTFKFGYNYTMLMLNRDSWLSVAGEFAFDRRETARPLDNSGNTGSAFASFVLGAADSGNLTTPSVTLMRWPYHAFYVQDDWKITPRLTANLGLRVEINSPAYEKRDRMSYFDAGLPNPAADGMPGALRFVGQGPGRDGRRSFLPVSKGFGPRAGVAFQLTHRTVLRGGFGVFYAPIKVGGWSLSNINLGFVASPSWASADQGVTPAFYWDKGWPDWARPPFIDPGFSAGLSVPWVQATDIVKLPSTASWNFAVSHALPHNLVLDLTYTGSKGTHLATEKINYMQIDPRYASLSALLTKPIDDPAVAALGFKPPFPSFKALLKSNATLGQALRMFPQYTDVVANGMNNHSGNSTYHALMLRVSKRFSSGLTMMANYTWSKLLTDTDASEPWIGAVVGAAVGGGPPQNHYNRRLEKSYAILDLPHQFKLTGAYDLPFGKGKKFFTAGPLRHVFGDWNLSAFIFAQSGFPMGVIDSAYNNLLRGGTPRPNVLTNDWRAPVSGDRFDPDKDLFFNAAAFSRRTNPSADPFGNAPRLNGATRMFGIIRENVSITRGFRTTEKSRFEFRWEIYDLLNHKTWNKPVSADLANVQFGRITSAAGNRTMQGGLKFVF